ncbi:hypothetical protein G4B88_000488 [Cannabis sativa]|uniref:Uncharacterized protein n=2 Tax=Cannabis sativa TaxID=3483 RepID=A0A7J6EMK9_CANSA|nr:hypothetical protein G4B88_000488 [Cannabis sativa]
MKGVERKSRVEQFSPQYYGICALGGMISAGSTHFASTPLDCLKVHMHVNPVKYNGFGSGLSTLYREQGPFSLWRGWSGKLCGYGLQGGAKYGFYEYFKNTYSDVLGDSNKSFIYFISSISAQVIADMALCPFEAVKVRVQTQPSFAKGMLDGFPKFYATEGFTGFYRGLLPLWGRNIPFSMIMFTTFEHSVDFIYRNIIQNKKENCSRSQQLTVSCIAGFTASTAGAIVSNPADIIVSSLYKKNAGTIMQAIRNTGIVNLLTRSLPVRMTIIGPLVTTQWFLYDSIKLMIGLPTSGGLNKRLEEGN